MSSRLNIAFYAETVEPIGGIETWLYYVLTDLSEYHNVELFYDRCDPNQLKRLVDNGVKCSQLIRKPKKVFDILFKGYCGSPNISAKHYIHTIHACFSEIPSYKFILWNKTDGYLAVSQRAKNSFIELYGNIKKPIDVIPNYVPRNDIPVCKNFNGTINMVMASRLTHEKGLRYVINMVRELDMMDVNYHIDLFTVFQKIPHLDNGKVSFIKPRLDIDFSKYHYLIQLSDSESYCYSVHEALSSGTAVIVKDIPAFKNIVKHGYNGYIYPDISNITDIPVRFEYKPTGSIENWLQYINNVVK